MAEATSSSNPDESTGIEDETETDTYPDNYIFVVALDFGTTYSGYAFSSRKHYNENPLNIQTNQGWQAGGVPLLSFKTPTSILLKNDGSFIAFGYEAEDKFYSEMANENHKNVMLFRRFKMKLYNKMVAKNLLVLNLH